jgi:hypothetical protein
MDESSKDERTPTRFYGYSEINLFEAKVYSFACINKKIIIAMDTMEDSCTKQRFKEFVECIIGFITTNYTNIYYSNQSIVASNEHKLLMIKNFLNI